GRERSARTTDGTPLTFSTHDLSSQAGGGRDRLLPFNYLPANLTGTLAEAGEPWSQVGRVACIGGRRVERRSNRRADRQRNSSIGCHARIRSPQGVNAYGGDRGYGPSQSSTRQGAPQLYRRGTLSGIERSPQHDPPVDQRRPCDK